MSLPQLFDITSVSAAAAPNRTAAAKPYKDAAGIPVTLADGTTVLAMLTAPAPAGMIAGQAQKIFSSYVPANPSGADIALYTVTAGKTFFLTGFSVYGSPSTGNPLAVLKYNTTVSSGAITLNVAAQAVTITHLAANANLASGIFVGGYLDIDVVGGGSYERVKVTVVSTNAAGIVTGFSGVFTANHAALALVGVPIATGLISATTPIQQGGSSITAPGGSVLTLNIAAFTGTATYNVSGYEA
jgi:hypothetical protein